MSGSAAGAFFVNHFFTRDLICSEIPVDDINKVEQSAINYGFIKTKDNNLKYVYVDLVIKERSVVISTKPELFKQYCKILFV